MQEYVCFIDESGDHNLNIQKSDNTYNVFILGAVIFTKENYEIFDKKLKNIKKDLFGDDDFIIHTAEITRPNKSIDVRNIKFNNQEFRKSFYTKINDLIQSSNFVVSYCAIKKNEFRSIYGNYSEDPYMFCYENLLNRIMRVSGGGYCTIYPEKRGHVEDIKLETEMLKLKTTGSAFYTGVDIQDRILGMILRDKRLNDSGLQLADLIVSPIGRYILSKASKPNNEIDFSIIKSKIPDWGWTIFP